MSSDTLPSSGMVYSAFFISIIQVNNRKLKQKLGKIRSVVCISNRAYSFTSLKEDLHQDINGGFAFSWCLNGTFP